MRLRRFLIGASAPIAALVLSTLLASLALVISDNSPVTTFTTMFDFGIRPDSLLNAINRAVPLYLSGLAVAIGFKMGLFNIGVDGQYRLAALLAAAAGAAVSLPGPLHVVFILVVAMIVGALWAGIAGFLKITRGVSEVISTIMLNFIATGLGAYLLTVYLRDGTVATDRPPQTPDLPDSALLGRLDWLLDLVGFDLEGRGQRQLDGFIILAIVLGVGYHVVVNRTRFGFDLRASGMNPFAARASGVSNPRMVMQAMLLSGAIAGLVAMPTVIGLGNAEKYSNDLPTNLGFDGIAVALLGRNHAGGVAAGALLFGLLERSAQGLTLEGIPAEIIVIMKGAIVLSVVIAYEVVGRVAAAQEAKVTARAVDEASQEMSA